MNKDLAPMVAFFRQQLSQMNLVTFEAIKQAIDDSPFAALSDGDREELRAILESSFSITQGTGYSVKSDYKPWLNNRRADISFYYWDRLRNYLIGEDLLPPNVISRLDLLSDEILDYCGNPGDAGNWSRRGMVMGHVQSGKTTNYTGLICKAADAGYKVIILLAGLTNSLRAQTQQRLDSTFIGRMSIFNPAGTTGSLNILNYATIKRFPLYGTTRDQDFNRAVAQNFGVTLTSLNEPTIFVTKKHKGTLENLRDWIRDQSHGESVSEPLLLIDDEADNASINTSGDPVRSTAINRVIREILQLFERSSYVGYTATPFANIFIDPNSDDEMLGDELFPRHFIKALDAPTNYVGAHRLFDELGDLRKTVVRVIDDYGDSLPLVQPPARKNEFPIGGLPPSLLRAVRVFLLTIAIRHLNGDGRNHCSMMINVTRFNDVQANVEGEVYKYLQRVKDSVAVNARARSVTDPIIVQLREDCEEEFGDLCSVGDVMSIMHEAMSSVRVITVNMRGGTLDYEQNKAHGLHVIAIGGLALSRGLTLEGLTVSYIIRNASASDTLMQMARWFGYRAGYEDFCRLYLPQVSLEDYDQIHLAIEELNSEIRLMEQLGGTPEDFGLKVRQSPTGIRITAANKMRTASEVRIAQDYSGRHIEGHALFNDASLNRRHADLVRRFFQSCGRPARERNGVWWPKVDGPLVTDLVRGFRFPPVVKDMARISTERSLLDDYLADRLVTELKEWDVYVPGPVSREATDDGWFLGSEKLTLRRRGQGKVDRDAFRFYGNRNRVADPADAMFRLSSSQDDEARRLRGLGYLGDRPYCMVRERPMLVIHLVTLGDGRREEFKMSDPVVTLSVCLPRTSLPAVERTYQVNQVYREAHLREMRDNADDDESAIVDDR